MTKIELVMSRYEGDHHIRKLGFVLPITNSERMSFACPRLWSYSYVECFEDSGHSDAITYGVIWHKFLEILLSEMRLYDRVLSSAETLQIVDTYLGETIKECLIESGGDDLLTEYINFDKINPLYETIKTNIIGWMLSWKDIMDDYRVLEIELAVSSPIFDDNGDVYHHNGYIVEEEDHIRLATTGEEKVAKPVSIPFIKVGKIDVLLECRRTGDLWVCDHKTTSSPSSFDSSIPYDVQLPSYAFLLYYEINEGFLQKYKGRKVGGIFYDVYKSSVNNSPKLLKNGKLSTAKSSAVPSWIYEQAIHDNNLPISEYRNHLAYIKNNVDTRYYLHRFLHLLPSDLERCASEDYAIAEQISKKRSALVKIDQSSDADAFDVIAYRFPLCQRYGNCKFSSVCVANNHPSVIYLNKNPKIKWVRKTQ